MKVYKFGGASVKNADAVKNLAKILSRESADLVVVVSAMHKTTNALENILLKYFKGEKFIDDFKDIVAFHHQIINNLFKKPDVFYRKFNKITDCLLNYLNNPPSDNFDKEYDAVVSFGEILSTKIISCYLNETGIENLWIDAREVIKTDDNYRAASVDLEKTKPKLFKSLNFSKNKIFITQGFIGSDKNEETTTLGREGSDYTAAVIANLMNAESLTLWKDVAGIYNADPKEKTDAVKLDKISYREATELAYFGAKVIHPKTAKPLMNKDIELSIRSFNNVEEKGTSVANYAEKISPVVPIFIFSKNQVLVTISSNDFIDEYLFEKVFSIFRKFKTKVNLLQNSALNLSLCFDYNQNNFESLLQELKLKFKVKYNSNLSLLTIRHYTENVIKDCTKNKKILLEQKNRLNAFFLLE